MADQLIAFCERCGWKGPAEKMRRLKKPWRDCYTETEFEGDGGDVLPDGACPTCEHPARICE